MTLVNEALVEICRSQPVAGMEVQLKLMVVPKPLLPLAGWSSKGAGVLGEIPVKNSHVLDHAL